MLILIPPSMTIASLCFLLSTSMFIPSVVDVGYLPDNSRAIAVPLSCRWGRAKPRFSRSAHVSGLLVFFDALIFRQAVR